MNHTLRKGQAEVIGGLIIVSVLLVVIIPLTLNIISSTTTVGTRNFILRSQFEVERWSEKLAVNGTKIVNPSPVEITIVRIWKSDGTPIDIQPRNLLAGGGEIDITELASGITSIYDVDALVTARGRVFKIEELIPPTPGGEEGEGGKAPLGLTGEEILGGKGYFNLNITIQQCMIGSNPCSNPIPAIYYEKKWIANISGSWVDITTQVKSGETDYADLDNNGAPEMVVLHRPSGQTQYEVLKSKAQGVGYRFTIRLNNYVEIKNNSKLIAAYIKILANVNTSVELTTHVTFTLVYSGNSSVRLSNQAVLSSIKIPQANRMLLIYEGYVLFPVMQFDYFANIIKSYPGLYHLDIGIIVNAQQSTGDELYSSGIEYVTVVVS